MKLTLTLPDDLAETYQKEAEAAQLSLESVIGRRLLRFKDFKNAERIIVLAGKDRQAIEAIFQIPIEQPADLVRKCQNLAKVGFGPVHREFSPGEMIRLRERAGFLNWPVEKFIEHESTRVWEELLQ
jgi:hypothetical protein